jgi:hypothetical protein
VAIQELTAEQVRTLTLEEKDRWWRDNVYMGDQPQLTIRAALTGILLGGLATLPQMRLSETAVRNSPAGVASQRNDPPRRPRLRTSSESTRK